jgi:hypothetical protein
MPARRLQYYAACRDPAEPVFELTKMPIDATADVRLRGHSLEIDFNWSFHGVTRAEFSSRLGLGAHERIDLAQAWRRAFLRPQAI